ncbi:protein of unknown function [Burkholderia multivorans]
MTSQIANNRRTLYRQALYTETSGS